MTNRSDTLNLFDNTEARTPTLIAEVYSIQREAWNTGEKANFGFSVERERVGALTTRPHAVAYEK